MWSHDTSRRAKRALRDSRVGFGVRRWDTGREHADRQVWIAESRTEDTYHFVYFRASAQGVKANCTCEGHRYHGVCPHAAAVLVETGHARWWTHIVAYRVGGRPMVALTDGFTDEPLADDCDGISWGTEAGAHGRWWLSRRIGWALYGVCETGQPLAVELANSEHFPVLGWRKSAAELDQMVNEARGTLTRKVA